MYYCALGVAHEGISDETAASSPISATLVVSVARKFRHLSTFASVYLGADFVLPSCHDRGKELDPPQDFIESHAAFFKTDDCNGLIRPCHTHCVGGSTTSRPLGVLQHQLSWAGNFLFQT